MILLMSQHEWNMKFKLHMQCSIVHSKFQNVTNNHQMTSNSQCLLQMQVEAH